VSAQEAIDARSELYECPTTGLKTVFQEAAVVSQFGRSSSEYAMVAGIRYCEKRRDSQTAPFLRFPPLSVPRGPAFRPELSHSRMSFLRSRFYRGSHISCFYFLAEYFSACR
jgi:hypothetical protein